jgi:hypothetical protein
MVQKLPRKLFVIIVKHLALNKYTIDVACSTYERSLYRRQAIGASGYVSIILPVETERSVVVINKQQYLTMFDSAFKFIMDEPISIVINSTKSVKNRPEIIEFIDHMFANILSLERHLKINYEDIH